MKIGLVRHLKVKLGYPYRTLLTPDELGRWFDDYDASDIEDGEVDLGSVEWKRCFTSDLSRAENTAVQIYNGKIIKTKQLREIRAYPIFKKNIRLPFLVWAVLVRVAWLLNHKSQLDSITDVKKRIEAFIDEILLQSEEDVLIVSHGALMIYMRKELLKRGFKGPKFTSPANGKLYIYEKN
jgi:broad specificity phosphatase PhoE